jgi:multidrug efflux pump subunit AcrA (membrane-fusion protein)
MNFKWLLVVLLAMVMVPAMGCSKRTKTGGEALRQGSGQAATSSAKTVGRYHCPMHPQIVSEKPGECPICGMDLVPIEEAAGQEGKSGVSGLAPVTLSTEARQRMGLKLGAIEKREMIRILRLPARIVPDETRQIRVTTKIEGYVEILHVSATGQVVKKGDPLLTIYSPALVAAQEEYRIALQSGMKPLIEAARQRLINWDLTADQIAAVEKTNRVERTLTLYAPVGGVVTEKTLLAGQKIMPGESLMVVTDCSVVWAEADVAEADLPLVRVGLPVELSFPNQPGQSFSGEVSFLPPGLNAETHTLKARVTVSNPDGTLKLGMYADAGLRLTLGERTVVPETAVMQTGTHSYVFRDDGAGKLTPIEIRIGVRSDGYYEVLSGVAAGDRVVTSANFLVDSESSIRAAMESPSGDKMR